MEQPKNKQQILLEAGTNELEVLVFSLGRTHYGVNVAKVREIIGHVKVVSVPMAHPAVVGVFKLRDSIISLVDLQLYFEPGTPSEVPQRTVILMEYNDFRVGFVVDKVDRIHRLGWDEVRPMPVVDERADAVITSVCEVDGHLALMVDFEKIAFDISGDENVFVAADEVAGAGPTARGTQRVLLAEDSPTIRKAVKSNLIQAGFGRVTAVADGSEAWKALEASLTGEGFAPFTLVVTDIEMPQMDGLHLCKRIKEHPELGKLPVVVFSSLVSDANLKKCKTVGADAAITKPQLVRLVEVLDGLLAGGPKASKGEKAELVTIAS